MSLSSQSISGFFWSFLQQAGTMLIVFAVSVVLARKLPPEDFGVIAIFKVFIALSTILINGGLTTSLIRTKDANNEDYSTVFYFNVFLSCILYVILFFSSGFIANYYGKLILEDVIKVYSVVLIIQAFAFVQMTVINKKMDFKIQFKIQLPTLLISGLIGILMAYYNYGVWSLVYMGISQSFLQTLFYWTSSNWRPILVFDKIKLKNHLDFGFKITMSNLIDMGYKSIYTLVIGKSFSLNHLGLYDRANNLQQIPVANLANTLNKVTFPLFCKIQDDVNRLREAYRMIMKVVVYLISPIMILCIILARPIIVVLLTDKWIGVVPYFQILCLSGIIAPLVAYNLNILQVKGKGGLYLKIEILKKIIGISAVIFFVRFGIYMLLWGYVITTIIDWLINSYFTGKVLNYKMIHQLRDVLPIILISCFSGIVVYLIGQNCFFCKSEIVEIIVIGILYVFIYLVTSFILRISAQFYLFHQLRKILNR